MKLSVMVMLLLSLCFAAQAKGARDMVEQIHWLGHDAFRITGSKTVYLDPYHIERGATADYILITHKHGDHCSPDDVKKIQSDKTLIIAPEDCLGQLTGTKRAIKVGETLKLDGIEVTAVPAYNVDKKFHPKDAGWVGYLLKIDGVTVYFAGDTDRIPEMKTIKTDIALLPVSGTYVMTADEAVQAAQDIKPAFAIPMHYGSVVGKPADAQHFKDALRGKVEVVIKEQEK